MATYLNPVARLDEVGEIENPPGVFRRTLTYNDQVMICHFRLTRGAEIPMHNHPAVQAGYVVKGSLRFFKEGAPDFMASPGTSYSFEPDEVHGVEVLEDAEVIECFTPVRPEYIP